MNRRALIRARFATAFAACAIWSATFLSTGWAADKPVKVLILSGQNNHNWRATTPELQSILTQNGRFAVDVTEHPETCDAATFSKYDVLLSNWNTFGKNATVKDWPPQTREAFVNFVRNGGGFVVVHAGGASFPDWSDYQKIIGGTWETLERVLQRAGHYSGGLSKIELARTMAAHMDPARNTSASFNCFAEGLAAL